MEKRVTVFLKRINYKSKNCDNLECNEVIYRIYALTLKRIVAYNNTNGEANMKSLLEFLERLVEVKYIKVHDDLALEQTAAFLERDVFSRSKRLSSSGGTTQTMPNKGLFVRCVTICVAGLNQILRRFSQHYRSLYRLAHFYSKFIDLRVTCVVSNLFFNLVINYEIFIL